MRHNARHARSTTHWRDGRVQPAPKWTSAACKQAAHRRNGTDHERSDRDPRAEQSAPGFLRPAWDTRHAPRYAVVCILRAVGEPRRSCHGHFGNAVSQQRCIFLEMGDILSAGGNLPANASPPHSKHRYGFPDELPFTNAMAPIGFRLCAPAQAGVIRVPRLPCAEPDNPDDIFPSEPARFATRRLAMASLGTQRGRFEPQHAALAATGLELGPTPDLDGACGERAGLHRACLALRRHVPVAGRPG